MITSIEPEFGACWANVPINGNTNRTARMLLNICFGFMVPIDKRRMWQKTDPVGEVRWAQFACYLLSSSFVRRHAAATRPSITSLNSRFSNSRLLMPFGLAKNHPLMMAINERRRRLRLCSWTQLQAKRVRLFYRRLCKLPQG